MADIILVAIIGAVGTVIAAGTTAYFTHLANNKKLASSVRVSSTTQPITKRVSSVELNVRVRPGANEPILTTLNQGMKVQVFNEISEVEGSVWVKICIDNSAGWVNGRFLK